MAKSKINVNIPQRLVDKLRYGSTNNTTEWQFRFRQSGYRILLSLLFYVSSKKCVEKKETILPGIGIYYSFFHLGLGLMSVDPRKNIDDISNFPLDHFRQNAYGFDEISDIPKSEIKQFTYILNRQISNKWKQTGNKIDGDNRSKTSVIDENFIVFIDSKTNHILITNDNGETSSKLGETKAIYISNAPDNSIYFVGEDINPTGNNHFFNSGGQVQKFMVIYITN